MKEINFTPLEINNKSAKSKFLTGFTKMVASGNDFVIVDTTGHRTQTTDLKFLARCICNRKYGVGADGLLILGKSKIADVKMRVFNADGSEAQMCGNGAHCVAFWLNAKCKTQNAKLKIETKVGIIESKVNGDNVKIKLTDPKDIKLDMAIKFNNRTLHINFINTGVPHAVVFVEGLHKIDVLNLGRLIRYHKNFSPKGTNVDFVEAVSSNIIKVRTYERGVEDETLSCGTGAVGSALIFALKTNATNKINVHTKSGETLSIYFNRLSNSFNNVWLQGKARIVFEGKISYQSWRQIWINKRKENKRKENMYHLR